MKRRLVSAQLRSRADADLAAWVEELTQEGRLSDAVRDGLRVLRWLEARPEAAGLVKRGLIMQALEANLVRLPTVSLGAPQSICADEVSCLEAPHQERDLEQNLDDLLKGL